MIRISFSTLAGLAVLTLATSAAAHARLVQSSPAANETVTAPTSVSVTFNEVVAPKFSGFALVGADGKKVPVKTAISKDHKSVTAVLASPLPAGAYRIEWRAAAVDDGHHTDGSVAFTVK
jgi:copper resistance protein C